VRIAVIADLHGNRVALEEVVKDIRREGVDRIVCLGDVVTLGPEPAATVDLLRSLDCPTVLGNTDEEVFREPEARSGDTDGVRIGHLFKWCAGQLDDRQAAFLRGLPRSVRLGELYCCHGSPRSAVDRIEATTPTAELAAWTDPVPEPTLACGHTHLALLRRFGRKTLVNPGSVGVPLVIDPATGAQKITRFAEYAILTARPGGHGVEFRQVEFDPGAVRDAARRARLPHLQWYLDWWAF